MDVIKHNLKFLAEGLDRLDRKSIADPCMKEIYDQIQQDEIERFVKDSMRIIKDIKRRPRD